MHLTRIELDPHRREVGKWLSAPNTMHAALMKVHGGEGRLLWRLDRFGGVVELLVQSAGAVDFQEVAELGGVMGMPVQSRDMAGLLTRLAVGQSWNFRLTASPTQALSPGGERGRRGKVVPLVTRAQQLDWLAHKAAMRGFDVGSEGERTAYVEEQKRWVFKRHVGQGRGGSTVTLNTATFTGVLVVRDPQAVGMALQAGVGRAKGYGCGLLTLARP